jgi:hypothetical protein
MKRYTIGLILIIIIFNLTWAQSTVIFKNRVMWGEDSIDSVKGEVEIIVDNETITIKKRLQKQRTYDFSEILSIKDKNDKVIWSFEEYEREKFEILCDKNKNTKLLFVNLKDDVFGISDELYSLYDSTCFIMLDNYSILGFFDKNKLNRKEINDFHLMNAARELGADLIISGYAYQFNVPFKYAPTTSDANTILAPVNDNFSWESLGRQLMGAATVYGQKKDRAVAIMNAGVYVNITLFAIDVKTGEKKFMMKNRTILKVG